MSVTRKIASGRSRFIAEKARREVIRLPHAKGLNSDAQRTRRAIDLTIPQRHAEIVLVPH